MLCHVDIKDKAMACKMRAQQKPKPGQLESDTTKGTEDADKEIEREKKKNQIIIFFYYIICSTN